VGVADAKPLGITQAQITAAAIGNQRDRQMRLNPGLRKFIKLIFHVSNVDVTALILLATEAFHRRALKARRELNLVL
jgi:hypothetical protein